MSSGSIQPRIPANNTRWPGHFDLLTWTHVPDLLITFWLPQLSGSELKISLYVVRHTYGYHRETAAISFERFLNGTFRKDGTRLDWGAGVKRTQLKEGLPALVETGLLVRERQQDQRGGDTASSYALNLRGEEAEPGPTPTDYRVPAPYAFTPVPNQVFDVLLPHLKERQLKTLLYITHHTSGLKRRHADISKSQMLRGTVTSDHRIRDRGVGIAERSLDAALKDLVDLGVIFREERRSPDGSPLPTRYGLNVRTEADHTPADPGGPLPADSELPPSADSDGGLLANSELPLPADSEPHERHGLKTHEIHVQQHSQTNPKRDTDVVVALTNLGVTKRIAHDLTRRCSEELIRAQIDMLSYRPADDPAAVLVKAIREDWAPPAGYETPEQREARADREAHVEAARDEALQRGREYRESWPRRMIEQYEIDQATLDLWERVQGQLPGLIGAGAYNRSLADALLAPPGATYATVLVPTYSHKLQLRLEHHRALEQVLHCELGREVRVEIRYAP